MAENIIINGTLVYALGLVLATCLALPKGYFKKGAAVFVLANLIGFIAGASYLMNFSGRELILANFSWFFSFKPTLTLLSGIFFTAISGVSALVGVFGMRYLELYEKTYNPGLTQALTAAFVLGMQGVLLANNSFVFLFFWEVMSITSFFLVLADRTQESLKAAFLYFIMTHLGASAIMGGFLILSKGSMIFEFTNIALASAGLSAGMTVTAFLLFLFGFGSKAGLVPFHVWLPEAHPQAPSNVSAMMSGLMLKVAVYGFITVVFRLANLPKWAGLVVIALGLLSGIVGVLYALIEKDLKRIFAYSSIENMGIIFTMLGLALYLLAQKAEHGVSIIAGTIMVFAIFHAISHMMFKTSLFLSSGVIISRVHTKSLELMGGLAKLMPIFSFAFLLAILGSLPLIPYATFYGEWGLIQLIVSIFSDAAFGPNQTAVLLIILSMIGLIGGLAIFAMIRVYSISMLGLTRAKHLETAPEDQDQLMTWPIFVLVFALMSLGIFARPTLAWLISHSSQLIVPASSVNIANAFSSISIALAIAGMLFFTIIFKKFLSAKSVVREYHTWDCGQPINSTMEYSATAFSAPVRFFFLRFLGSNKMITSVPVVATNQWIRKYTFSLVITSMWKEKLYKPLADTFVFIAEKVRIIQSGRVQYYLAFLLATLIVTLIIAL